MRYTLRKVQDRFMAPEPVEWTYRRVAVESDVALAVHEMAPTGKNPLLVIHGGPDWDHSYLRKPLCQIAPQRRLLLPDLRGCGASTRGLDLTRYTPDAAAHDLVTLLDALEIPRVDVLGFSYGGLLAQRVAVLAPARIRRLVLASTSVVPVPESMFAGWDEYQRRRHQAGLPRGVVELTPEYCHRMAARQAELDVWNPEALSDWHGRLSAIHWSSEWWQALKAGVLPAAELSAGPAMLRALTAPILILHGKHDMRFPVAAAKLSARALPGSTLTVIEEAGHMVHVDQPAIWLSHLQEHLNLF
jgi:pimeloyl-ACP methyl ester carboxylesterase